MPGLEVWKFGGASLADASAVRRAAELVRAHRGPLVVVASAMAGVTDLLLEGARRSAAGDPRAGSAAASALRTRYARAVRALFPRGMPRRRLLSMVAKAAEEYRALSRAMAALGDLAPRASDVLLARGERLAAALLGAALRGAGRRVEVVDAIECVATDAHHAQATPNLVLTRRRARRRLSPLLGRGIVAVVPGFIGRAPDASLTTLGRGGSDLTATMLGRALAARRVVLWKDVPGILTADPRTVPDARLIPQLHHREAAEVAYFGARVLHPRALIPMAGTRGVVEVRSFHNAERPGTEVSARRTLARYPVKALATISGQALVTVAGKGMMGVPGIAARTFEAVHHERLSVSTIFQGSSESSIGFTLPEADSARAVAALRGEFREELRLGLVDSVTERGGLAVVAVVGEGMAGTPGIAARVFTALAQGGINVIAIAQGSSERNISFVVGVRDAPEAARRVHAAFQLAKIGGGRPPTPPTTDVVLLGFGRVGRALAEPITARRSGVRVVGLVDRSGFVFDPRGIGRRRLLGLAREKDRGRLLAELGGVRAGAEQAVAWIGGHAVSRPVLVDVTAEETGRVLLGALSHGFDLVLANKRPLAGSAASYARLLVAAASNGRRLRYEATVGAGLPILDTFRKLVESGDRVLRVDGCVSGTLGHVLGAVGEGRAFSQAVREAVERGYSEPDPREDLSGRDAARKALILARLMGYRGAPARAEDLVPPRLRRVPRAAFLGRLAELDAAWRERASAAQARGRVPRYVVTASARGVRARLVEVPVASAFGALTGTRNLISFTTRRYHAEPLVVSGPGAGAEVTAAGILNDLHELAAR
jgi:aspartokinase/homoserine dehydrogenase 1